MIRTVFGSNKSGTALIPIKNASVFDLYLSTRVGDIVINKGDGSALINRIIPNKNKDFATNLPVITDLFRFHYSPNFTGNIYIKFLKGLKDVYSFATNGSYADNNYTNISDLETFFAQFPNLFSVFINEVRSTAILKGDLSRFPDSVQKVNIPNINLFNSDCVLNFSNYRSSSNLKSFIFSCSENLKGINLTGDLASVPISLNHLYIKKESADSSITYTSGKTWTSIFDTLNLPIALPIYSDNDNLINDLGNSVTSVTGGKSFTLVGYRSPSSDVKTAYLISLGATVNVKKIDSTGGVSMRYIRATANKNNQNAATYWREIQIFNDTQNIALGLSANIVNGSGTVLTTTSLLTDGNLANYEGSNYGAVVPSVIIDLKQKVPVTSINIRHFYQSGRIYYGTKLEYSDDGIIWNTLFDSAVSGNYAEVDAGKTYTL